MKRTRLFFSCFLVQIILYAVIIKSNKLFISPTSTVNAELIVYSGTRDPIITLSYSDLIKLEKYIKTNKFVEKPSTRVMGYKGFKIFSSNENSKVKFIKAIPQAELYLLENFKHLISEAVYLHVLTKIKTGVYNQNADIPMLTSSFFSEMKITWEDSCDATPIRGPDDYPTYDPDTDDQGCFEKMQYDNNCYNYGTDVLTNTFSQPGVGSGQKWSSDTCVDIKASAIRDGLQFIGQTLPEEKPAAGHLVALLIWPKTNFHWVRLDNNGQWSHKPGQTAVRNYDNKGDVVTDPASQDFAPWTEFCGYFISVPSKVTIG